jgi:hypothetical protein
VGARSRSLVPREGAPAANLGAALERGDDLVQALTVAKYALCASQLDTAAAAVDAALAMARHSLTELADVAGSQSVLAASLVRRAPALRSGVTEAVEPPTGVRLTS